MKFEEITKELAKEHKEYSELTTRRTIIYKRIIELKRELTEEMNKEDMQQIKNPNGTFYFSHRKKAKVIDYEEFTDYVYRTRSLDLLHMHLSKEVERYFEKGEFIPGVEIIPFKILNVKGAK